jgi:uncharacterized Zn-binding protein involved in type VI secretion
MTSEENNPGEGQPGEGQLPKQEGQEAKESKDGWQVPKVGTSAEKKWETKKKEVGVGDSKPEPHDPNKKSGPAKKASLGPLYTKDLGEGSVWSSKKGEGDKTYVEVLRGEAKVEVLKASYDLDKKSAKLTIVEAKAEGSVVHAQVDLADKLKHLIFGGDPPPPPPAPTAPMAARVTDLTMHLGPLTPGPGSPNVFIGGMPAWRVGLDMHVCPAPGAVPHGAGPTLPGDPTVLINGAPAARATDYVVEPTAGPDVIAIGCPTVLIGKPTPPPVAKAAAEDKSDPWVIFESVASGDVGKGEAKADIGAEADLSKMKGKALIGGEVEVAALKGELPLKVRLRIPFTSYYVGLGVKVEGALLTAGAGAHAGVKINDGKTLFEATAGAKADAGLAGLGVNFGVDISKK